MEASIERSQSIVDYDSQQSSRALWLVVYAARQSLLTLWFFVYAAHQVSRTLWYVVHHVATFERMGAVSQLSQISKEFNTPSLNYIRFFVLYAKVWYLDWGNIWQGYYRANMPVPLSAFRSAYLGSRDYLRDSHNVVRRRQDMQTAECRDDAQSGDYPEYFLQNFHFQTGGWLTEDSAERYDMQVETLFLGTAAAMRRQALPFISQYLGAHPGQKVQMTDLGCGTGVFLKDVLSNYPQIGATALDLSPTYLEKSRATLASFNAVDFRHAKAEETGLEAQSQDIVTASYLFHELPPSVRRSVVQEAYRVLKPGGVMILMDSLQYGDEKCLEAMLRAFPLACHEPYFAGYCEEDLGETFSAEGFTKVGERHCFLTKTLVFQKPAEGN